MSNPVLFLKNVSLCYGQFQALNAIDLEVKQGEKIAIIGANGAGKSSLFDLLTGFIKPSSGEIWLNEVKLNQQSVQQRVQLGVMRSFQHSRLFKSMTVFENLLSAMLARSTKSGVMKCYAFWPNRAKQLKNKEGVFKVAKQLNLFSHLYERADTLNYANQRLLELGMLRMGQARVMLLDEPTAGLSESETELFIHYLKGLNETILFIEHDWSVVKQLADHVLLLEQGRVVAFNTPEKIFGTDLAGQRGFANSEEQLCN